MSNEKQNQIDINMREVEAAITEIPDTKACGDPCNDHEYLNITDNTDIKDRGDPCYDPETIHTNLITQSSHVLRSTNSEMEFPSIKIRNGHKTFNEDLIRCLVQSVSKYKVTTNDLLGICVDLANGVFGQKWGLSEDNDEDGNDSDDYEFEEQTAERKRRRKIDDRTYIMPSRRSMRNYLADASYMNLEMVAKQLSEKSDCTTITVGLDDTTKSAGHRVFNIKTDHITVAGPTSEKKTFTTGYVENMSHSGEDAAKAYDFKLKSLAILADCSTDEIKEHIDFWMTDRAGDCSTMLQHLDVGDDKILKCCAHIILGVDHGIEKVLRETEQRIGIEKLIDCSNVLRSPSSSILTVGLIAITKLLSPSHASHSVSLYNEFMNWLQSNNLQSGGFKGFVSNRFGRIAELAKLYLEKSDQIRDFFDAIVDTNSNKLVLAVSTFIKNDWFQCACEVYSLIGDMLIFPMMDLFGIDGRKCESEHKWANVKSFFSDKLPNLTKLRERFGQTLTGKGQLIGAIIEETIDVLNRQLSQVNFFDIQGQDNVCTIDEVKLKYAPITNMGCESSFARLNNQMKVAGGMTTVETHSKKCIVATNCLLADTTFTGMCESDRRKKWKWARSSSEVIRVKKLEVDFLATVRISKQMALKQKEKLKQQKFAKTQKLLDACKMHGGPVTATSVDSLKRLNEKQLLSEIGYLRITTAPDIRQKRRVKSDNGRFRFQNFTINELRESIRSVVHPEYKQVCDIEPLLRLALTGRS